MQFASLLHINPFESLWFWVLLLCQWIFHLTWIGGVPADILDQAGEDEGGKRFNQYLAIQRERQRQHRENLTAVHVALVSCIVMGLAVFAILSNWPTAQGALVLLAAQAFFIQRNWALLRMSQGHQAPQALWHRERKIRLFAWVVTVLLVMVLANLHITRIG